MKHLTIVTGASRGMGFSMAEQLCGSDAVLLCISRSPSPELDRIARERGGQLSQWSADLGAAAPVALRVREWLSAQRAADFASATLINNAGVVGRMGPLDPLDADALLQCLRVDLEAPMLLTAAFLEATRSWTAARKILNISSGLGRRAIAGGAMYCAAKAGLDHFSRCAALDEAAHSKGARIVSLAPGIIDTDMQAELRASDPDRFPGRDGFVQAKESGGLSSPAAAAQRVLAYLARPDFGHDTVADVRDA
ncbi:MAG: SDR family NAD(P)-dependent oxidoreductase [Burkholderiaceae bacterium]